MLRRSRNKRGGGGAGPKSSKRGASENKAMVEAAAAMTATETEPLSLPAAAKYAGNKRNRRRTSGDAAAGRALTNAISTMDSNNATASTQSSNEMGRRRPNSKKSKNDELEWQQQQQQQQQHANIHDGEELGHPQQPQRYANATNYEGHSSRGRSSSSGTASLTLSSKNSFPPVPFDNVSASARRDSATSSLLSPTTSHAGNTSVVMEDDQIITRLENECIKLSLAMSRLRKYTQEWFLLETTLKNSTEELEAAKEDWDLHCYLGGTPSPLGSVRESVLGSVKDSAVGGSEVDGSATDSGGIDIPETVLLLHDLEGSREVDETTDAVNSQDLNSHDDDEQQNNNTTHDEIRLEYERVESELQKLPKFSPDWFQLKEELVELSITLNDEEEESDYRDDKPREIEVIKEYDRMFSELSTSREEDDTREKQQALPPPPFRFRPVSSLGSSRSPSPIPTSSSPLPDSPVPQQRRGGRERGRLQQQHGGSISPYPTSSGTNSIASPSQHCLSPYHSLSNGTSNSNSNASSSRRSSLKQQHSLASDELRRHPQFSKEWFDLKTQTVGLEDQLEELENSSSSSVGDSNNGKSYTSGWSSCEEDIMSYADDLECVMVAEALKQAQSRHSLIHGSSDEEEEGEEVEWKDFMYDGEPLTMAVQEENVELEKHINRRVDSAVKIQSMVRGMWHLCNEYNQQRGKASVVKIQAMVRGKQQHNEYTQHQEKATIIQSFLRKEHAMLKYQQTVIAIIRIQSAWRSHCERQSQQKLQEEPARETETSMFDSMLDEFALMLGDEEDNEFERQSYHATIIQEKWDNHCACRPFVSLRRRAVLYQCLFGDEQQQLHKHPHYSQWQIFSVMLLQGLWRGHCARKRFQVLMSSLQYVKSCVTKIQSMVRMRQQLRRYCHLRRVKSCVTKIQSLVRGRRQRRRYVRLLEKCIVIQAFLRKEWAASQFKRVLSSIVRIQRLRRKALRNKSASEAAAALAAKQPKKTELDFMFDEMEGLLGNQQDDEFEKQNFNAMIIQEQWMIYKSCKPLVSMRRRAVQYQALAQGKENQHQHFHDFAVILIQSRWRQYKCRRVFQWVQSRVVKIQAMVRSMHQHRQYNQQQEKSIVIQSFVRKYWVATGQVYTDQRQVFFHSTAMGIRLQRGKDDFVRILSVTDATVGSSIVREGTIAQGDMVMEAAGVDLRSPISNNQWRDTVEQIRNAPRPMKFVVASGTRRRKAEVVNECQYVSTQLQSLISVVRIQRVWRNYCYLKHVQAETLRASIVIQSHVRRWLARCLYDRELENAALLAECEAMLAQLEMLRAATVIQSHVRRWLARSSYSRTRESSIRIQVFIQMELRRRRQMELRSRRYRQIGSIRIQAFLRMKSQRTRYIQTLTNVTLIQGFVRGWLVRKNPPDDQSAKSPSPGKIEEQVLALSMQLCQMQEFSPEWQTTADKLHAKQEVLRKTREMEFHRDAPDTEYSRSIEEVEEISSEQDESDDSPEKKPAMNFWLLREKLENNATAPIFPQNENQSPSMKTTPERTKPHPPFESLVPSQAHEEEPQGSPENEENEPVQSVARMRQALEDKATAPVFPQNEVNTENNVSADSPHAPVPDARASRAGEMWSPEDELHGINTAQYKDNLEKYEMSESVRATTPAESSRSTKSGNKKRLGRKKKKKVTPEENMRNLSIECVSLSHRMKSLPKFSPEWTLSKLELKLISDELEYLYAESMAKGARV